VTKLSTRQLTASIRAERLFGRLRTLQRISKPDGTAIDVPKNCRSRIDELERTLQEAIRRDGAGDVIRDGFPSGRLGAGGQDTPQSSTESAAWVNLGEQGDPVVDMHHHLTELALAHLQGMIDSYDSFQKALVDIVRRANPDAARRDPSGSCIVCDRHVPGTASDRLRRGMCEADFRAWDRAGRPDLIDFKRERREPAA
jgi:hypothetical protein